MLSSTKFGARACCAVAQRAASQRFFTASPRLMATGDDWDGSSGWSASSTRVIFDAEPGDSDAAPDGGAGGRRRMGGSLADAVEQSPRHKMLFEQSNDVEALGLARYKHFTLPGDAALVEQYKKLIIPAHRRTFSALEDFKRTSDSTRNQQRKQIETVRQFDAINRYSNRKIQRSGNAEDRVAKPFKFLDNVRCTAHECPVLVKKDFMDSFPDVNLRSEQSLTVIAIQERHDAGEIFVINDPDVDQTHKNVACDGLEIHAASISPFSEAAREICRFLQASGHWADFVDPYSGKLHCADPPTAGDWPTSDGGDEALSRFAGLSVERCGFCTVVSMPGRRSPSDEPSASTFVVDAGGLVFTSASPESLAMKIVLASVTPSKDGDASSPAAMATSAAGTTSVDVAKNL